MVSRNFRQITLNLKEHLHLSYSRLYSVAELVFGSNDVQIC